jgi:hypothetical protein
MSDILYERTMAEGRVARIRRLTPDRVVPVRAVIEIDRRTGSPHAAAGDTHPPALAAEEGESEPSVVASLLPLICDDEAVSRLVARSKFR